MATFAYSLREEEYHDTVEADTHDEAARHAVAELCSADDERVFVGRQLTVYPDVFIDAGDILEMLGTRISESVGEVADGWPDCTDDSEAGLELTASLKSLIRGWLERHDLMPTFYSVVDIREFTAAGLKAVDD